MKTRLQPFLIQLLILIGICAQTPAASVNWINPSGGDWSTAANWDANRIPDATDSVTISGGGVGVVIRDLASVGTLTLNPDVSLTIEVNGILNVTGPVVQYGAITNRGTILWKEGAWHLNNHAGLNWFGEIWNEAGGLFEIQCDQPLTHNGNGIGLFHNAGTLRKTNGSGTTDWYSTLDNSGLVEALSGTLRIANGSNFKGTFHAAAGAAIYFSGGSYILTNAPDFRGPGDIKFLNGNLNLDLPGGTFHFWGGTLEGTNFVRGDAVLNWYGGSLSGGALIIQTQAVVNLAGIDGKSIGGSVFIQGGAAMNVAGGGGLTVTAPITVEKAGNLTMAITANFAQYASLTNRGTILWKDGAWHLNNHAGLNWFGEIWNGAGGLFEIQCDQPLSHNGNGIGLFHNAGTLRKTSGSGTTDWYSTLDNSGLVEALSGTLRIANGSNLKGTFQAAAGAAIHFNGGSYVLTNAPDFRGLGDIKFLNGSLNLDLPGGTFHFWGGTLEGTNFVRDGAVLNWYGGSLSGGALIIQTQAVVNLTGIDGKSIGGSVCIQGGAAMNVAGGGGLTVTAPITVEKAGNLTMAVTPNFAQYASLTNRGTILWKDGAWHLNNHAGLNWFGEIWNEAGGLFEIQCDQPLSHNGNGIGLFHNAGTLRKTGGSGTTDWYSTLDNSGLVEAFSGTLRIANGSNLKGTFQAAAGAAIHFSGGSYILANAPDFRGPGDIKFLNGNLNLDLPGGTFHFWGGTLEGTNFVRDGAVLNWYGGSLSGGALIIQTQAVVNLTGIDGKSIGGSVCIQGGAAMNVAGGGGLTVTAPITVEKAGNLTMAVTANFAQYASLTNRGTILWKDGAWHLNNHAGLNWSGEVWNEAGGLFEIQCDQTLTHNGNGLGPFHNAGTFRKSAGAGSTLLYCPFDSSGQVDAQSGSLSFVGGCTLSGGSMRFGISGFRDYGKINLPAGSALNGTLLVNLKGYIPSSGATFSVLTYSALTGMFASADLAPEVAWQTNYTPTALVLKVQNVRPLPARIANRSVDEQSTLSFQVAATEPDSGGRIVGISIPENSADAQSHPLDEGVWSVQAPPYPLNTKSGIGYIIDENFTGGTPDFALHDHVYVRDYEPDPARAVVTFHFDGTATVGGLETIEHGNGVSRLEGFAGDTLESLLSVGNVTGDKGAGPFTEGDVNTFRFGSPKPGRIFRFIIRGTALANGYALYRAYPLDTNGFRIHPAGFAPQTLAYSLINPPAGASLQAESGLFSWTPGEAQGPGTYGLKVLVSDNGTPPLAATNDITVDVREVNSAPAMPVANQTIDELRPFSLQLAGADSDIPANAFSYALVSGPPGLAVSSSGQITWTPMEAQGPFAHPATVRVIDNGVPPLSANAEFSIQVREVNSAPVLAAIANISVAPGQTASALLSASDADFPLNTLLYGLVSGPAGARVETTTGQFTWRAPVALAGTTQSLEAVVSDNGSPSLEERKSFTITVGNLQDAKLKALLRQDGKCQIEIEGPAGPDYAIQRSSTLRSGEWTVLETITPATMPVIYLDYESPAATRRFYRVQLGP